MEEDISLRRDRIIRSSRLSWIRSMCIPVDWRYSRRILEIIGWVSGNGIRGKT